MWASRHWLHFLGTPPRRPYGLQVSETNIVGEGLAKYTASSKKQHTVIKEKVGGCGTSQRQGQAPKEDWT